MTDRIVPRGLTVNASWLLCYETSSPDPSHPNHALPGRQALRGRKLLELLHDAPSAVKTKVNAESVKVRQSSHSASTAVVTTKHGRPSFLTRHVRGGSTVYW